MFSRLASQVHAKTLWFCAYDYLMDFSTWTQISNPQHKKSKGRGARRVRLMLRMPYGTSPPISVQTLATRYPEVFQNVTRVQWNQIEGLEENNCFNSGGRYQWQLHEWHSDIHEYMNLLQALKPWRVATASYYHEKGGYNKVWGDSPGKWTVAGHHPLHVANLDQVEVPPTPGEGESQALRQLNNQKEFLEAFPDFDTNHPSAVIVPTEVAEDFWMHEPEEGSPVISTERTARFQEVGRQVDAAQRSSEVFSPEETPGESAGSAHLPEFREGMTGVSESSVPARGSPPPVQHPWPDWNEVKPAEEERRVDQNNGKAYTWEEFQDFYKHRAGERWYASEAATKPFSVWHTK